VPNESFRQIASQLVHGNLQDEPGCRLNGVTFRRQRVNGPSYGCDKSQRGSDDALYRGGFHCCDLLKVNRRRRNDSVDGLGPVWDNPTMIVTLDSKRRVSIPAALAPATPGDEFDASFDAEDDVVTLRRVAKRPDWLEVLKSCPVPMDDLPPRSRQLPKKLKL